MKFLSIFISLLVVSLYIVIGCDSGGSSSNNNDTVAPAQDVKISSYVEKPGDIFTYEETIDVTLSNGDTNFIAFTDTEVFSQVEDIPPKYSYSGDIKGPYILNTQTEDGSLDGYEYISLLGTEIIDDDLDTFTRIDDQTTIGDDDPNGTISTGDSFTYFENSTLFDSDTGDMVGNEIYEGSLIVEGIETISVPAGSFESLKIKVTLEMTTTEWGNTETASFSGSSWFAIESGFMIKLNGTMKMTLNENNLTAVAFTETELSNYQVGATVLNHSLSESGIELSYDNIASELMKFIKTERDLFVNR